MEFSYIMYCSCAEVHGIPKKVFAGDATAKESDATAKWSLVVDLYRRNRDPRRAALSWNG